MWKTILSVCLCVLFVWAGIAVWNWSYQLATLTGSSHVLWDCIAFILGFLGFICSAISDESKKNVVE